MPRKPRDEVPARSVSRNGRLGLAALPVTTLKELRKGAQRTQEELAEQLGVGQDTISRLEKRRDMLLSTLRHYVECVGGELALVVTFPDQHVVVLDHLGEDSTGTKRDGSPDKGAVDAHEGMR